MKARFTLLFFVLFAAGCSDEFDDTSLLKDLSGIWFIETPYIGLTVDGDYSRVVPISYPDYSVGITPKGEVTIYLLNTDTNEYELISTGKVSGLSKKKLRFDAAISSTLKTIGFFEADDRNVYSIIDNRGVSLDINYTFKNSSGKPQDEGFVMYKIGITN